MNITRLLPLLAIFFAASVNAQDQKAADIPFLKPCWGSVSFGMSFLTGISADSGVFHSLAKKDDTSLHPNLDGYFKSDGFTMDGGGEVSLSAAFKIRNKDKSGFSDRAVLRASLIYCGNTFVSNSYSKTREVRFDTLSGQTSTLYLDSVYNYYQGFSYNINQVGIDASLLFNTNADKLFGLYGGISFGQYFSVKNTVGISKSEFVIIKQTDASGVQSNYFVPAQANNYQFGQSRYTTLAARSCFTTRLAIPLGVTLKLAKTKKFWKHIQLFIESRPGVDLMIVAGYKNYLRPKLSVGSGFRVLM